MNKIANISGFIKNSRKKANLTQPDLSKYAGVGIRFVKELEAGKETVQVNKVNQVLKLFGHKLGPVPIKDNININSSNNNEKR
jgi:y4mF family transcriptional regulator